MEDVELYFFLNGDLTPDKRKEVEKWIRNNPEHFDKIKRIWENSKANVKNKKPNLKSAWDIINPENNSTIASQAELKFTFHKKLQKIAAILIICIAVGSIGYFAINKINNTKWIEFASKNTKNVEVVLADGTKLWLNKESSVRYPKKFKSKTREIILKGEALFKVATDTNKPFLIHAGSIITRVLGTSFTINAIDTAKDITISVITGKVAFYNKNDEKQQVILTKGEKGTYTAKEKQITKSKNHDLNFMAWKTGILTFNNSSLPEVCKALNNYYDTLIFVRQPELVNQSWTARFQNKELHEILSILEITFGLTCKHNKQGIELIAN